jgi:hypothetical protein
MLARHVVPAGARPVTLYEDKISVRDTAGESEALPRRYTLTRDDRTANIFLSVGADYDPEALSRPSNRRMRDEVLAELTDGSRPRLMVHCFVEGPELAEKAANPILRRRIFEKEMPLTLAVIRYGDRFFFERRAELDEAEVIIRFEATDPRFEATCEFGRIADYRVTRISGESRRLIVGAAAVAAVGIGALVVGKLRNR